MTGATLRTFEVGTASGYNPVTVQFGNVSTAGNLTAKATLGDHPSIDSSSIDANRSVNVYWRLTNSGIAFNNYNATFNFNPGDIDAGANTSNFIVGKFDSSTWTYPTVGTRTSTSTQATGMTSFSDFAVGESSNIAPIITDHPDDTTVTYGNDAIFAAAATGTPAPTVQWQVNDGGGWGNIPGATSTTLTVTKPPVSYSGYQYRAVFTNSAGSATTSAATLTVTPKNLTVSGITANNKVYDGNTTATLNTGSATLVGVVAGDDVTLNVSGATGTFNNRNVGNNKTVTISGLTLTGADAGNYSLTQPTTTANITHRDLTVTATGINKTYDGTTTATVNLDTNKLSGDDVTASYTSASFDTKNVGTGKTVSVSGISISGTDAINYNLLNTTTTTTADITTATVTPSITANNKVYDGTTTATLSSQTLDGVIGSDDVSLVVGAADFNNKNVGTGKTVTATGLSLGGVDAANYQLSAAAATTTADITSRPITVTAVTDSKIYDGTTVSTGIPAITSGTLVGGDTPNFTQAFDNKNVGTNKILIPSGSVNDGNSGNNYNVTFVNDTTGVITAKELTVSGITANNKVYDGNTTATLNTGSATLVGVVAGDDVTLNVSGATGTFNNRNVGNNKTVTISGLTLTGADAGNYSLTQPTTTANIIAPRASGGGGGGGWDYTTPPIISNIAIGGVTETTVDIYWETNKPSTSQVEYWDSFSVLLPLDNTLVLHHFIRLTALTPGTTYHYKIMSKDAAGNLAVSPVYTFTTLGEPNVAFIISNLSISPSEVDAEGSITISVIVTNTGSVSGSYEITLKLNGAIEETRKITLDAANSQLVSFFVSKDKAGTYTVDIAGLTGSFRVKEKSALPVTPETPTKFVNWLLFGSIIGTVVIAGLLAFFVIRRRA